jgi:hypothetical protein
MRRWAGLLLTTVTAVWGCAAPSSTSTNADDITQVQQTDAKEQSVGNCWIYATLGWVESMHLAHSGETLNLSESYLTYLHWFQRITSERFLFDKAGDFNTGDFVGHGQELVKRYGLLDEGAFIAEEGSQDRSARQEAAEATVKAALKPGGELGTPDKRRNAENVRSVLNRAFKLPKSTSAQLTRSFGLDLSKTRGKGATLPSKGFHDPATMIVATASDGTPITLDDALGDLDDTRPLSASRDRGERRGKYAWQRVDFGRTAAERAATVLRMKQVLNAGFPVPIDWYPAWASMRGAEASFHAPIDLSRKGGWHSSIVHDYQLRLPGGELLAAGTPVTDTKVLGKTLDPNTTIEFLRFKNSWGREVGPLSARGYTDATWDYLATDFDRTAIDYDEPAERGAAIDALILPPESWANAKH